jgi:PTS system N-acetylgalactosamine-specific IIA component
MSSTGAAIIVGHGDFAAGVASAIEQITGFGHRVVPISNRDLSAETLQERVRDEIARTGAPVIFTDLPGGSATIAARAVARDSTGVVVVCGASLAIVLDYLLSGERDAREAAIHSADRGRAAIAVFGAGVSRVG